MNDEFSDPLDDELRRRFDAATPRTPSDPDAVLDTLRPQLRRARTRHRAVIGGAAAGFVALIAVAGFALTGGTSNPNVNTPPANRSTPRPSVTVPTEITLAPSPAPDPNEIRQEGTNGGGARNDTGTADDGSSSNGGSSGSSGSGGETATTVPAPQSQTFSSSGGSITVSLANGALSLTGTSPAAGATAQVNKNEASRVEVEFFDADHQRISRIRVDLVDSAMVPTID